MDTVIVTFANRLWIRLLPSPSLAFRILAFGKILRDARRLNDKPLPLCYMLYANEAADLNLAVVALGDEVRSDLRPYHDDLGKQHFRELSTELIDFV